MFLSAAHTGYSCEGILPNAPRSGKASFSFLPPIYKISMGKARRGAAFPGNACPSAQDSWQFLTFEGQTCSLRRSFTTCVLLRVEVLFSASRCLRVISLLRFFLPL